MNTKISDVNPRARQSGVTLVELMIAMAISLFMIGAVLYVVVETQVSYRHNDRLARVQESGRLGIEILAHDARMAGFYGCLPPPSQVVIKANPAPTPQRTLDGMAVRGFVHPSATTAVLTGGLGVANSSVIVLRSGSPNPVNLAVDMATVGAPLQLSANPDNIQVGDLVSVSDCEAADIFRVSAIAGNQIQHGGAVNTTALLSKVYGQNARIMRMREEAYYVANSGRNDSNGAPVFSLFRVRVTSDLGGNLILAGAPAEEVVENVADLRSQYGVDVDGNRQIDSYLQAALVGAPQWEQVRAFRVDMLSESEDGVSREARTFQFDGATLPASRRLRQSFEVSIALRNLLN